MSEHDTQDRRHHRRHRRGWRIGLGCFQWLAWRNDTLTCHLAATVGVGLLSGWTWIPCVGRELGGILNAAQAEPWQQLGATALYLVSLSVPLAVVAALVVAWPKFEEMSDARWLRALGLTIVGLVGALMAATLVDDVAGDFARRSSF